MSIRNEANADTYHQSAYVQLLLYVSCEPLSSLPGQRGQVELALKGNISQQSTIHNGGFMIFFNIYLRCTIHTYSRVPNRSVSLNNRVLVGWDLLNLLRKKGQNFTFI